MGWSNFLFVYGTLKKGYANHHYLVEAGLLGEYRTANAYPLAIEPPWWVPSLYERPGQGHRVTGELYVIDDGIMRFTDELEGLTRVDGYYRREIEVAHDDGSGRRWAWTYFRRGHPPDPARVPYLETYVDRRYVPPAERDQRGAE